MKRATCMMALAVLAVVCDARGLAPGAKDAEQTYQKCLETYGKKCGVPPPPPIKKP